MTNQQAALQFREYSEAVTRNYRGQKVSVNFLVDRVQQYFFNENRTNINDNLLPAVRLAVINSLFDIWE